MVGGEHEGREGIVLAMRRTGFRAAAVLCVVLAMLAPARALGGEQQDPNLGDEILGKSGGVRYRSDSMAFDVFSRFASAEVGCGGPRWHLLGGGSRAGGAPSQAWHSFGRPLDFDDPDDLGDDGWYTGGFGPAPAEFTGYAICIRDGAIRYRFRQVADSPSGLRSGSVGCGGGRWHVTTGSTFIATSDSWSGSSYPKDGGDPDRIPDDRWQGRVFDTVGGIGGFYMYAVCARMLDVRYVKRAPVSILAGESVGRRVRCKRSEHVVGGGARTTGPADRVRLVSAFPYDGADADDVPDDGWQMRVHKISGPESRVTAFAICLA